MVHKLAMFRIIKSLNYSTENKKDPYNTSDMLGIQILSKIYKINLFPVFFIDFFNAMARDLFLPNWYDLFSFQALTPYGYLNDFVEVQAVQYI